MSLAPGSEGVTVSISIDTEEDNWGSYAETGATTENIAHLPELQDLFGEVGARPTYLVNYPPLTDSKSVEVLGTLAESEGVEIGGHCHPWNTPPLNGEGQHRSMMCSLPTEENRAKLTELRRRLLSELDVTPVSFRAGRWGLGPTVAGPLAEQGFEIDCSVAPFIDWTRDGGPDYSYAPHRPYRFRPERPLQPDADGPLLQMPTTIGFLSGDHRSRAAVRRRLERSRLARFKVVGVLDRAGVLTRRWLSPETSSGETMVRLADAWVASGETFVQLTFHSCTLLPGATPFVRGPSDRSAFLESIRRLLAYCSESGFTFRTLSEAASVVEPSYP